MTFNNKVIRKVTPEKTPNRAVITWNSNTTKELYLKNRTKTTIALIFRYNFLVYKTELFINAKSRCPFVTEEYAPIDRMLLLLSWVFAVENLEGKVWCIPFTV